MTFNPGRLAAIDRFLAETYVKPGRLPGAQLKILHRGELVHQTVMGHADVVRATPLRDDSIYRIYSMTKPLTSVALMMLVEDGLLLLDDPVETYIPQWKDLRVYRSGTLETGFITTAPERPMQVIDLLRHTAGLTYGFQLTSNVDAAYRQLGIGTVEPSPLSLAGMIDKLATLPLLFSPGQWWNYSVATDVVGWLVEVISGQKFEDFLTQRILVPLGMDDTGFFVPPAKAQRLASCHALGKDGRLVVQDDAQTSPFLAPPTFVSGGGGLVSTADDYVKFAESLRTGNPRLIGRKTLELMTANHLPGGLDLPALSRAAFSEAAYEGVGFGLGFATTTNAHKTLVAGNNGDYFWGGAASTYFWIDPAEELTVVFLTQLLPSSVWPIRRQLRTMVYAALD